MILSVVRSAGSVSASLREIAGGGGDLTRRIVVKSRDELGLLAGHFNAFQEELARMVREIQDTAAGPLGRRVRAVRDHGGDGLRGGADQRQRGERQAQDRGPERRGDRVLRHGGAHRGEPARPEPGDRASVHGRGGFLGFDRGDGRQRPVRHREHRADGRRVRPASWNPRRGRPSWTGRSRTSRASPTGPSAWGTPTP
ncbi:MAG: methyl-accepting chemotaxis protein [Candidatus Moduliflexus flocculans]|nr:methyl-accepting chemotaxis protein [Candidatus Moduliflexus flocculans]